jgi:DNA-directed RNA polymerase specialized sigma24 family protein
MGSATNKPDQHRQYEARYALDNADGVRLLLGDYHALIGRQYCGDTAACDILIDLATAIGLAGLTNRQRQALKLVYVADLTQKDAGLRMGLEKDAVNHLLSRASESIAEIYYYWAGHGEGYAVSK